MDWLKENLGALIIALTWLVSTVTNIVRLRAQNVSRETLPKMSAEEREAFRKLMEALKK